MRRRVCDERCVEEGVRAVRGRTREVELPQLAAARDEGLDEGEGTARAEAVAGEGEAREARRARRVERGSERGAHRPWRDSLSKHVAQRVPERRAICGAKRVTKYVAERCAVGIAHRVAEHLTERVPKRVAGRLPKRHAIAGPDSMARSGGARRRCRQVPRRHLR